MLMLRLSSGLLVIATAGLCLAKLSTATMAPLTHASTPPEAQSRATNTNQRDAAAKTVQIVLATEADVLIENPEGKRFGMDFTNRKFVSEIPEARAIAKEN